MSHLENDVAPTMVFDRKRYRQLWAVKAIAFLLVVGGSMLLLSPAIWSPASLFGRSVLATFIVAVSLLVVGCVLVGLIWHDLGQLSETRSTIARLTMALADACKGVSNGTAKFLGSPTSGYIKVTPRGTSVWLVETLRPGASESDAPYFSAVVMHYRVADATNQAIALPYGQVLISWLQRICAVIEAEASLANMQHYMSAQPTQDEVSTETTLSVARDLDRIS